MEVTVAPRDPSYRPNGDGTRAPLGTHRIGEAAMRNHASNETETVLVMACAMIAIFVAILNTDATTAIGFFH